MKKNSRYMVFSGITALAMGMGFTGCSHDFDDFSPSQEITDSYNRIFIETFGQPAADQDWGFGDTTPSLTRAQNANANEWADVTNSTGFGGWLVPDTLTDGQKLRVKAYFQANPNLTNEDPHLTNFFVQQVYKGGTSVGANSTEVVRAADGSAYNSNNMNLLTVGQANVHINNFNRGDATAVNVLDNGANIAEHTGETYHKDKIMLMVDIDDTSCFGYHETGSSNERSTVNHNDKWALVAASVIDQWAEDNKAALIASGEYGEAVTDKWNRSFIGFDLAIKEGDQCFMIDESGDVVYADYSQLPEGCTWWDDEAGKNYVVAWDGEKVIKVGELNADWSTSWYEGYETLTKTNGTKAGWLDTNKNFYVAGQDSVIPKSSQTSLSDASVILKEFTIDGIKYQALINLPAIQGLLDEGYLPVNSKNLTEWVKPGVSDGYFSDWIVTITKADRTTDTDTWGDWIRIIAEDLTVKELTDFDFNDVVFDARLNSTGTKAQIKILAAGGTLPLTVGWDKDNTEGISYQDYEVHNLFNRPLNVMINTNAKAGVDGLSPVYRTLTGTFNNPNDIKICVQKSGQWIELTAHKGKPASKLAVGTDYEWCRERQDITEKYSNFTTYVQENTLKEWWKAQAR
ncbi:MAG: hypothetical protein IJ551_05845 [Prevotella sp.]|nr:hypothetical protein [Prevotella sp.]